MKAKGHNCVPRFKYWTGCNEKVCVKVFETHDCKMKGNKCSQCGKSPPVDEFNNHNCIKQKRPKCMEVFPRLDFANHDYKKNKVCMQ